jgi:N-acetyl-gamma-glutamyl-phosphate reductase
MNMHKVAVVGASGYAGVELVRILLRHPQVEIGFLGANTQAGNSITKVYPHLHKILDANFSSSSDTENWKDCSLVFTALPHGESEKIVPTFLNAGKKVIDLSSDYRLNENAVYGLPEWGWRNRIVESNLVANPGCYPTACLLALRPLMDEDFMMKDRIIFDCKSGATGAGRAASIGSLFCEVAESIHPYGLLGVHRHQKEIEKSVGAPVQFTPHLLPMKRGILATSYIPLKAHVEAQTIWNLYKKYYEDEPFVRLLDLGSWPKTAHVSGSNYCDIGLGVDVRTKNLIVVSAIDNLVKGAAGQAIQNMNIMMQLPETLSLQELYPLFP